MVTQTAEDPDITFAEQAKHLSNITSLTPREAECYLRRQEALDGVSDSWLAEEVMGIVPSTFSGHLSAAKDKLDAEHVDVDALVRFLTMGSAGGAASTSYELLGAEEIGPSIYLVIRGHMFRNRDDPERVVDDFRAHIVCRSGRDADELATEAPDGVNTDIDSWRLLTVGADTEDEFSKTVAYYLSVTPETMAEATRLSGLRMLAELGFDTSGL